MRFTPSTLNAIPGILYRIDHLTKSVLVLIPITESLATTRKLANVIAGEIAAAFERPLHIAEAHAANIADVPAACQDAKQTLTLVAAMPDVESRPYQIHELLVELALARQPSLQRRLADLLIPLQRGSDLALTLETLFDCGLDREKTSRRLHIHRRTLTYRIQRIRELTGVDPTTAHGIQIFRTALTATRLSTLYPVHLSSS